MRKFFLFQNTGIQHEISPLSYYDFLSLGLWSGSDDKERTSFGPAVVAFSKWLRHNELYEPSSFNKESMAHAVVLLNPTPRNYEFNPSGDGETWVTLAEWTAGNRTVSVGCDRCGAILNPPIEQRRTVGHVV